MNSPGTRRLLSGGPGLWRGRTGRGVEFVLPPPRAFVHSAVPGLLDSTCSLRDLVGLSPAGPAHGSGKRDPSSLADATSTVCARYGGLVFTRAGQACRTLVCLPLPALALGGQLGCSQGRARDRNEFCGLQGQEEAPLRLTGWLVASAECGLRSRERGPLGELRALPLHGGGGRFPVVEPGSPGQG